MNKRNVGACSRNHDLIVELSKTHVFSDIVKILNIPKNTLKDYCDRNFIKLNHGRNCLDNFTEQIKELAEQDFNMKEIAEKIGVSSASLRYHVNKLGIYVRNGRNLQRNFKEESQVTSLYLSGFSYKEISDKLNIPLKRVPLYLDILDIEKRTSSESRHLKNKTNTLAFSNMDNEEDVYWLGWILTDGCLCDSNSVSLSLKGEDVDLVKKFRDYISPGLDVSVRKYFHNQVKREVCVASVSVRHKTIADNLRKQNIEPRKSCKEKLPNFDYINHNLAPVFWRACIEGDGHVRKNLRSSGISLVGSEEVLTGFRNFCETVCKTGLNKKITKRNYGNPDFRLISYSGSDARKIMRVLWSSGSIFLERKKLVVESQLKHWGDR